MHARTYRRHTLYRSARGTAIYRPDGTRLGVVATLDDAYVIIDLLSF